MSQANWATIEKMVEKIIKDCIGAALYNGLIDKFRSKTFIIELQPNPDKGAKTSLEKGSITLYDLESNVLFHEMIHVYQAYSEDLDSYYANLLNLEIEAWYAQYRYVSGLPEYNGSRWEKRYTRSVIGENIALINKYINNAGNLNRGKSDADLDFFLMNGPLAAFKAFPEYAYKTYNYNRIGMQNFKNLKELSKNCK